VKPDGEIAIVGDVFCDIILRGVTRLPAWGEEVFGSEPVMCPGGVANVAVGAARLGVGTRLLARTKADDAIGNVLAGELAQQDDLTVAWLHEAHATALTVALPMGSERAMVSYVPPADDRPLAPCIPWDDLRRTRHLHLGSWSEGVNPLDDQVAILTEARSRGMTTSVDVSLEPDLARAARVRELLAHVDLFLPNRAEALQIAACDDELEALERLGDIVPTVVVKLGGDGAIGISDGEVVHEPACSAEVVDTTGAGDSFAAGFLYGYLRRWSLARCMRLGNVCGGITVTRIGSSISVPARREAFTALEETRAGRADAAGVRREQGA
jgi:sugar/nucleoside kinase (ribokinase family)